ncbi:hypothetical protein F7734_10470 [Scytonema sp. UIC 10036]|uniref:hypothetical protein n=1 Tax=Scytonema sp. UIC 10036 TaxID=2304196 RepID=UPI0012DAC6E5|nr:hypothetical protein [Scytonema sp. UIC 10036]MUG92850.1 hypothetical protein [Scytonema sp. UIC 10036]
MNKRLYFTKEKICIGSYDEVAKYEQKTKQSYWVSEFFNLTPDYNPVGMTLQEIEQVQLLLSSENG